MTLELPWSSYAFPGAPRGPGMMHDRLCWASIDEKLLAVWGSVLEFVGLCCEQSARRMWRRARQRGESQRDKKLSRIICDLSDIPLSYRAAWSDFCYDVPGVAVS